MVESQIRLAEFKLVRRFPEGDHIAVRIQKLGDNASPPAVLIESIDGVVELETLNSVRRRAGPDILQIDELPQRALAVVGEEGGVLHVDSAGPLGAGSGVRRRRGIRVENEGLEPDGGEAFLPGANLNERSFGQRELFLLLLLLRNPNHFRREEDEEEEESTTIMHYCRHSFSL